MALWSTIMRSLSLLGSTYGGYALAKEDSNVRRILTVFTVLRTIPIVGQYVIINAWGREKVSEQDERAKAFLRLPLFRLYYTTN